MEDFSQYAPDFPPERWTPLEQWLLGPFVTNPEGFVSVLHNLPPEIVGALCSRTSRAEGSLSRVFLSEYLLPILDGEDAELSSELLRTVASLYKHGFRNILNNQRAQSFYARWLAQYGDDSIAQLTGMHAAFRGISQVAMKFVEDQAIGLEPIEKSTRYVDFGEKVDGRYLYYVPRPDLRILNLLEEYKGPMDRLFDTYVALRPRLFEWLKKNFDEKDVVLEKKSYDVLRGLLPMSTLGQVAFRGNAQAWEYLINRTAKHGLGELRWIAQALKAELDKEIPSLLLRLEEQKSKEYQEHLARRRSAIRNFMAETAEELRERFGTIYWINPSPTRVTLIEWDPDAENKILAGMLFPASNMSWQDALAVAIAMPPKMKEEAFARYFAGRNERWQKVGGALENSYLRFEIVMNIGAYRDLHRHRMLTQDRQLFSTYHGYDVPKEIIEAGLEDEFRAPLEEVDKLFRKIVAYDAELAQYAVPLAYRIRFYQWENFRELFWETELRTIPQGHPDYRVIEQEKYRLVAGKFPLISRFILVDMKDYRFARRGTVERIVEKEKKILDGLEKKG